MLHKKGIAISTLTYVIIALVGFFAISMDIGNVMMGASSKEAEVLCHQSIIMRMKTSISGVKTTPFYCKTISKEVSGTKEEVMKEMADSMARCWWMFGEGRYIKVFETFNLLGLGSRCFNCYAVKIDEIEGEDKKIGYNEFRRFLMSEDYEDGRSYIDYIQQGGGPGYPIIAATLEGKDLYMFEEKAVYGVAYFDRTSEKEEEEIAGFLKKAGFTTAAVGATAVGIALALPSGGTSLMALGALAAGGGLAAGGIGTAKELKQGLVSDLFNLDKNKDIYYAAVAVGPLNNFLGRECMTKSTD